MQVRTWKCPGCGMTTEISYDWLADNGGPICGRCDCDMELQPELQNDGSVIYTRAGYWRQLDRYTPDD